MPKTCILWCGILFTATLAWSRDVWWRSDRSNPPCKNQMLKTVSEWCYLHLVNWNYIHNSFTEKLTDCTQLWAWCGNKEGRCWRKSFLRTRMAFSESMLACRNFNYDLRVKIDEIDYCDVFLHTTIIAKCHNYVSSLTSSSFSKAASQLVFFWH